MGLERFYPAIRYSTYREEEDHATMFPDDGEWCDEGLWYRAADVDALLATVREALATERQATGIGSTARSVGALYSRLAIRDARAALDALLSGNHPGIPDSSGGGA